MIVSSADGHETTSDLSLYVKVCPPQRWRGAPGGDLDEAGKDDLQAGENWSTSVFARTRPQFPSVAASMMPVSCLRNWGSAATRWDMATKLPGGRLLGGKDDFAADRAASGDMLRVYPRDGLLRPYQPGVPGARRPLRCLAGEAEIRQFLEVARTLAPVCLSPLIFLVSQNLTS